MDFYTTVLRKSAGYWVALCLKNGLVGQGINQEVAIKQLNEAIASFAPIYASMFISRRRRLRLSS